MRLICALISLFAVAGQPQTLPPPFPRTNAVKMLDNDRVQAWSVSWPKRQPTPLHRHIYDITGTYIAPGDRLITDADGSKRPVTNAAGGIVWQFKGLTHIEEGTSDIPLRAVMIELKGDGPSGKVDKTDGVAAFTGNAKPLLDNARVTVWEAGSSSGSDFGLDARRSLTPAPRSLTPVRHRHQRDTVVVWTEQGVGHVAFMPAGTVHTDEPIGMATKATIFELK